MSRGATAAGFLAVAGAGVLAFVGWQGSSGWSGVLRGVRTSAPPGTRAQTLQHLRAREAELSRLISQRESEIEAAYERRMASATFEGMSEQIEANCEDPPWYDVVAWFDPYHSCDDQIVEDARAEIEALRRRAMADRVDPLTQELETVRAEIDSVMLTA